MGAVDEQHLRTRIVQPIRHLGTGEPRIDRHEYASRPRHTEQELEIAIAVEREDSDPVTGPDAEVLQPCCEATEACLQLAPGECPIGVPRSEPPRRGLCSAANQLRHREHRYPPRSPAANLADTPRWHNPTIGTSRLR